MANNAKSTRKIRPRPFEEDEAGSIFPQLGLTILAHDGDLSDADAASLDVFQQMDAIEAEIVKKGGAVERCALGLNLWDFKRRLREKKPGLVFNLVESLDHSDRLQSIVPLLLENWDIPFTGSGSYAMMLSNNKLETKEWLAELGLPVAGSLWLDAKGRLRSFGKNDPDPLASGKLVAKGPLHGDWIVKAVESHASLYMDDASVMRQPRAEEVRDRLREMHRRHGQMFFAEQFIEGREFNISILAGATGGEEVLPAAEILFDQLERGKPTIVGYAAKWEEESQEYEATPRSFVFPESDGKLLNELKELTGRVWRAMDLGGYARIDYRVDEKGCPYILEANTNPCLTPGAGLAAAAERGGLGYGDLLERIARAALSRG